MDFNVDVFFFPPFHTYYTKIKQMFFLIIDFSGFSVKKNILRVLICWDKKRSFKAGGMIFPENIYPVLQILLPTENKSWVLKRP